VVFGASPVFVDAFDNGVACGAGFLGASFLSFFAVLALVEGFFTWAEVGPAVACALAET
jgi:hypothetical protein